MPEQPPSPKRNDFRCCSFRGCEKEGLYRAPLRYGDNPAYCWLCLEHVREHNARWNYFAGKNAQEIEQEIRRATVWERPTWPFGKGPLSEFTQANKGNSRSAETLPPSVVEALNILGLKPPASFSTIKKRYRDCVKQLHPDRHNGDHGKIAQFHRVQEAFATLEKYYAMKSAQT